MQRQRLALVLDQHARAEQALRTREQALAQRVERAIRAQARLGVAGVLGAMVADDPGRHEAEPFTHVGDLAAGDDGHRAQARELLEPQRDRRGHVHVVGPRPDRRQRAVEVEGEQRGSTHQRRQCGQALRAQQRP